MTDRKLQSLKNKWLNLLDLKPPAWKEVTVFFAGTEDPDFEDKLGDCTWSMEHQVATIRIAEPERHAAMAERGDSVEQTLVHELLHLLIQGHQSSLGDYDPMFERALNILSRVLVKSENKPPKKTRKPVGNKKVCRKKNSQSRK